MNEDERFERSEKWRKEFRALQLEMLDAFRVRETSRYKMLKLRREIAALEPVAKADEDTANELERRLNELREVGQSQGFGQ